MTSTIKVDNIQKVSDASNIIKKCSATTTVGSGAGNTVVVCGSTVTIGRCGGTVALASGATQTGFGASGAVTWDTTVKTGDFTAASGEGYFVNTTSGAVTVTLPGSPSAGNIVAIADYAGTAATNNIAIGRNSSNFQGAAQDGKITINRQVFTLVYVDGTQGWVPVTENDSSAAGPKFIAATGGTVTCGACGNTKIHTFTGPGTFCISSAGNALGSNILNYMVVAGGAGGGSSGRYETGGGGGGGYREANDPKAKAPFAASILASNVGLTAATGPISVTVGAGGAGGASGSNSIFSSITSAGGGTASSTGGSGGGGPSAASGANGNTPAVAPPQGNPGGDGHPGSGRAGGGGGAGESGFPGPVSGQGGDGVANSINDTLTFRSGGGGGAGGSPNPDAGPGGQGGGGPGRPSSPGTGGAATANTGGAGGGGYNGTGGAGGSGIVIIRYRYQ